MRTVYKITLYELGKSKMTSAFLQFEKPFPAMQPGDTLRANEVSGLENFSPLLEVVHAQEHGATLVRGQTQHQCLIFTRACAPQGQEIPVQDLSRLANREMMGDM